MTAVSDMRRDHVYAILSVDGMFSESVVFQLPSGGSTTCRAVVQPGRSQLRDRQYDSSNVEEIDVRVTKDPAAVDANGLSLGGLLYNQIGQGLVMTREGESDGRLWVYKFKTDETPYSWQLRFEYEMVQRIGNAHVAR